MKATRKNESLRDGYGQRVSFYNRMLYKYTTDLEYRKIPNEFRGAILNYNHRNTSLLVWVDGNDYAVNS